MVETLARQRKAAERARRKAQGLKRLEFWLPPALHENVKKYVARLMRAHKRI